LKVASRLALLLLAAGALISPAAAQERTLSLAVAPAAAQWRPEVRLHGVVEDHALAEALRSGLPLRYHIRVELWRRTGGPDRLIGARENFRAILRDPLDEGYLLDDGHAQRRFATPDACEAALERAFQPPLHPADAGRYYYLAVLEVETLSSSDLEELRRWLRGEARPAVSGDAPVGRAVESGLRRVFVRLLGLPARRYQARTGVFEVPEAR
jgi:hypothetical protein